MSSKYIFLSYILDSSLSAYGNGERINIKELSSINKNCTSNNTKLSLPTHFGTHLDFPFHFSMDGKTGDYYKAEDFIFKNVKIIDINYINKDNKIIHLSDLENIENISNNIDFLIIKTHYCTIRNKKKYWFNNPGLAPELSGDLKKMFPRLKAIGFDSISLSNFQNRALGRAAHKEFLCENNFLILEDMNLSSIDYKSNIEELYLSPLLFKNADGAPTTVIARIHN